MQYESTDLQAAVHQVLAQSHDAHLFIAPLACNQVFTLIEQIIQLACNQYTPAQLCSINTYEFYRNYLSNGHTAATHTEHVTLNNTVILFVVCGDTYRHRSRSSLCTGAHPDTAAVQAAAATPQLP